MPKFDPSGEVATSFDKTPGRWIVEITRSVTVGNGTAPRPGIETLDQHGQPRRSKSGNEMWSAAATVVDDHPEAPRGALILGINLLWGGKGRAATYALLAAMGHPVDAWKRETDPAKLPEITPEFFYGRRFVLDCATSDRGYLEPAGFMPFYPVASKRGPAPAGGAPSRPPKGTPMQGHGGHGAPASAAGAGAASETLPF